MKYFIGSEGPRTATLAIVAEKPGRDELENLISTGHGRPLIGASGRAVDQHLSKIGTSRGEVYLTNSVKHFDSVGNPTTEDIKREQVELYRELDALPNLNCIVAMGNAALLSLSNFHFGDITRRRGSVLSTAFGKKMVPTLHPAFYQRGEWRYKPIVEFDLKRALEQSRFPEIRRPDRTYYIEPTFREACDWLRSLEGAEYISFDIETLPNTQCANYWTLEQECHIWRLIDWALNQEGTCYVTQNGLFDCWHLWRHGVLTRYMGRGFDTMYAHRVVAPDLPHALHFLCSIYTEEPYYKDESLGIHRRPYISNIGFGTTAKVAFNIPFIRTTPDRGDYSEWQYNCKDVAVTLEVAHAEMEDMRELGLYTYFRNAVQPAWDALMGMRQHGIRVSRERLVETRRKLTGERKEREDKLKERLGWTPNTKSYIDMGKLFDQFGIKYRETPTGRPKIDEDALIEYARQSSGDGQVALAWCLDITKRRTIESSFLGMALDTEDHYHPAYDLYKARSGRDASEGSGAGGPQLQNIPESVRRLFVPCDNESEITCVDQAQAEAMVVAYEADDPLMIAAFEQGKDTHRVLASRMFRGWTANSLPPDDLLASIKIVCDACAGEKKCPHSERQIAKISGHAMRYMMGVKHLLAVLAAVDVFITHARGEEIRRAVISPAVAAWHERVGLTLQRTKWLSNAFCKREFYGLYDEKMLREGLAWIASNHVAYVNREAYKYVHANLPDHAHLLTQTHDSITISHRKADRPRVIEIAQRAYDITATIHGRTLRIPIEITHGPSWGEQH